MTPSAAYPLDRPEFVVHHPDDETLTVAYALATLRSQSHQRIAVLVEWLAEELARKNALLYEAAYIVHNDEAHRESVRDLFEQAKKDGLL